VTIHNTENARHNTNIMKEKIKSPTKNIITINIIMIMTIIITTTITINKITKIKKMPGIPTNIIKSVIPIQINTSANRHNPIHNFSLLLNFSTNSTGF